jgi:GNAT superfamily N-acetyltransferase
MGSLGTVTAGSAQVVLRRAVAADLMAIVALIAADQLLGWAVEEARRRGCALVQLTTDKSRTEAHRFYQRLGFTASHEGMRLAL